jgi:hypothetical protein
MFSDNFVRDLSIEMWVGRGLLRRIWLYQAEGVTRGHDISAKRTTRHSGSRQESGPDL